MKTSEKIIGGILAVVVLVVGVIFPFASSTPGSVGASSGPDHYNYESFYNGIRGNFLTVGGAVKTFTATSTQSAYTLTQNDLLQNDLLFIAATTSPTLTITLPASSTLTTFAPKGGDAYELFVFNNQAVATSTTFSGGTGTTIKNASSTCTVIGGKSATIRFVRLPTSDFYVTCGVQSY